MHWWIFPGLLLMFCSWYFLNPDGSRTRFVWWARRNRDGIVFVVVLLLILAFYFYLHWVVLGP
jgi:hypothetical protein